MIGRRRFVGALFGIGAGATAGVPAAPAPAEPAEPRGVACIRVHCPACGWQAAYSAPHDAAGAFVPPRQRMGDEWVDCACGLRYRARFWVEV